MVEVVFVVVARVERETRRRFRSRESRVYRILAITPKCNSRANAVSDNSGGGVSALEVIASIMLLGDSWQFLTVLDKEPTQEIYETTTTNPSTVDISSMSHCCSFSIVLIPE